MKNINNVEEFLEAVIGGLTHNNPIPLFTMPRLLAALEKMTAVQLVDLLERKTAWQDVVGE